MQLVLIVSHAGIQSREGENEQWLKETNHLTSGSGISISLQNFPRRVEKNCTDNCSSSTVNFYIQGSQTSITEAVTCPFPLLQLQKKLEKSWKEESFLKSINWPTPHTVHQATHTPGCRRKEGGPVKPEMLLPKSVTDDDQANFKCWTTPNRSRLFPLSTYSLSQTAMHSLGLGMKIDLFCFNSRHFVCIKCYVTIAKHKSQTLGLCQKQTMHQGSAECPQL